MTQAAAQPAPKLAVLVSGPSEAAVRRFLALYVKRHFGMRKNQWRARYREEYALVVLSRPLRAGQDPEALYGRHAGACALVVACLDENAPGSGLAATRDWFKAQGFDPVARLALELGAPESASIDQGSEVVNFVNLRCPWRSHEILDLDAYLARAGKRLW